MTYVICNRIIELQCVKDCMLKINSRKRSGRRRFEYFQYTMAYYSLCWTTSRVFHIAEV